MEEEEGGKDTRETGEEPVKSTFLRALLLLLLLSLLSTAPPYKSSRAVRNRFVILWGGPPVRSETRGTGKGHPKGREALLRALLAGMQVGPSLDVRYCIWHWLALGEGERGGEGGRGCTN
jgi:hypothetical protein